MEQTHELMDKNRIERRKCGTSGQMTAKSISVKSAKRKSGSCVWKAVELISGGLRRVLGKD